MNKDYIRRNRLLGFKNPIKDSDSARFNNVTIKTIKMLVDEKFLELDENQNYSPTTEEFIQFMEKYPLVKAHGYAISAEREDYRICIEGLQYTGIVNIDLLLDFVNLCRFSDEFIATEFELYSWWD